MKSKFLLVTFLFLLSMPLVLAKDIPPDNVFELESATTIDKFYCKLGFKDCFITNVGVMVLKEREKPSISQQTILNAGLREGTDAGYFNPFETTKDFKEGAKIGFCAMVRFEDPESKCKATGFLGGGGKFTINDKDYTLTFIKKVNVGDVERYCYVLDAKADDSPYVYSKVGFIASCSQSAYQGSKDFEYKATVTKIGKTCSEGWECEGESIRYVNADCTKQSLRTCDSGKACSGSYPNAKCAPKIVEVPEQEKFIIPNEDAVANNDVCENGEPEGSSDCKVLDTDKGCEERITYNIADNNCLAVCGSSGEFKDADSCKTSLEDKETIAKKTIAKKFLSKENIIVSIVLGFILLALIIYVREKK